VVRLAGNQISGGSYMYAIPSRVTAYALEPSALHFKSATPSAGYSSNTVERLKSIRNSRPFAEFFSQELKQTHSGKCGWHTHNSAPNGRGSEFTLCGSSL
jgi:hypothetical protein